MLKAKSPDISRYHFRGAYYEIYDAFPSAEAAENVAEDMRRAPYPLSPGNYTCKAIAVDLGPEAGRLRYGIFIAKGTRR